MIKCVLGQIRAIARGIRMKRARVFDTACSFVGSGGGGIKLERPAALSLPVDRKLTQVILRLYGHNKNDGSKRSQ